jgi:hypothetical protein
MCEEAGRMEVEVATEPGKIVLFVGGVRNPPKTS